MKPAAVRPVRDSLVTVAAELSLALEREHLVVSLRRAADALAEQNERLRELDRMKDQFVSSVSHELRTPLTSMVGYLELVIAGETGEVNGEQRRFLEIVNRNCDRLNRLVSNLLDMSRLNAGAVNVVARPVYLEDVVAAALNSIEHDPTHVYWLVEHASHWNAGHCCSTPQFAYRA